MTNNIINTQKSIIAVSRLTAIWAFTESGLGGILHAFRMPLTGLVVGGMAVILLALIAHFSDISVKEILKSTLIVLIIKAAVSPHTPLPAYLAVSFQGVAAAVVFKLLRLNLFSILLFSVLAMMESALQKLITLTLFFGKSVWKATDELMNFIAQQFHTQLNYGSVWLMGIYLLIYFIGGILLALLAYKIIRDIREEKIMEMPLMIADDESRVNQKRKRKFTGLVILLVIMVIISAVLFFTASNKSSAWMEVIKSVSWTLSAILIWYAVLLPLLTKLITGILRKEQSKYYNRVNEIVLLFPSLRKIGATAWQHSNQFSGIKKISFFVSAFINWSLVWEEGKTNAE
jgi:hypothetical protein